MTSFEQNVQNTQRAFNDARNLVATSARFQGANRQEALNVLSAMQAQFNHNVTSAAQNAQHLAQGYAIGSVRPDQMQQQMARIQSSLHTNLSHLATGHGDAGRMALQAFGEGMQHQQEGFFGGLLRSGIEMFHNTDKGGVQWGGIVGGLLGLGLAYGLGSVSSIGEYLGGGFTGLLATIALPILAIIGGAKLGNVISSAVSGSMAAAAAPAPIVAHAQEQQRGAAQDPHLAQLGGITPSPSPAQNIAQPQQTPVRG
ncbi:MAG: hypothetical protein KGJ06_06845 [Pseudomonadota bacterium]|nr:hypothetical protein [Pseudomonadota bacterium]